MTKGLAKKIFSYIFLFIFFMKMVIAIAPLVAISIDAASVNAVIMQIEIEHETKGGETKVKDLAKEYLDNHLLYSFTDAEAVLQAKMLWLRSEKHRQVYYPSVPTPPPNA